MYGTALFTAQPIAYPLHGSTTLIRLPANREPIAFRRFLLLPGARALLREGSPVEIGARAFDLLLVLLRARGNIVSKREIVERVWPSTLVDEGNLRFQVTTLRKVLGDDRDLIKTVTGRGYLLVDDRHDDETRSWTNVARRPDAEPRPTDARDLMPGDHVAFETFPRFRETL